MIKKADRAGFSRYPKAPCLAGECQPQSLECFGVEAGAAAPYFDGMNLKARLEDWLSLRPVIIHVFEGPVPEVGRDVRNRTSGNHYAWLLSHGSVSVVGPEHTVTAAAGDWLIAHPGERWQKFSDDARILSVQFQAKWPDGRSLFEQGLSVAFRSSDFPQVEQEAQRLLALAREFLPSNPQLIRRTPVSMHEYFSLQHQGLGFLVALFDTLVSLGLAPPRMGQTDERLLIALRKLDEWPLDLPFDLARLARFAGVTSDHLSRVFLKEFRISVHKYFTHRRQDHARRLLAHSALPIKAIAIDLGFNSTADFSSWFKRAHQLSPRQYRHRGLV